MTFGANPTTSTQAGLATNQFPISTVAEPGRANGDLTATEGGPGSVDSNSNRTAPVSMYIKDGGDVAQGAATDAAWSGSGAGSVVALLKKLIALTPVFGQAIMANSSPVTLASDQSAVAGKRTTTAAYTLASVATTGTTQNSGDIAVGAYSEVAIDITTTAQSGTNPTIQYFYERKGADNIYYPLWQSAVLTAAANTVSASVGVGMAINQSLGNTGRLRWVVGGTATPTYTHSLNIYAK